MLLLCILVGGTGNLWADTYEQLTSIANIDESAEYVLGIDGTGFHYEGTSSWGKTALPSAQTPIKYTLTKASDGNSFTAKATISGTTYYLQIPTSNTFSMATSTGTNTDIIIGTTQVSETNYAVANKSTTTRHLRINGTSGLRSYAGTTGTMAFFYKVIPATPAYTITAQSNNETYGTVSLSGSVITGSPKEGCRYANPTYTVDPANSAIVSQDGNEFTVTPSENTTVTINFEAIPTHTVTFSVNGTTTTQDFMEGATITFPTNPAAIDEKVFVGWVTDVIEGTTDTEPTFVTSATMGNSDVTYYACFAETEGKLETKQDVLTSSVTGITTSSYSDFSNKSVSGGSSAVYAGNCAGSNSYIQLRTSSNTGLVSTTSGGKVKKVTVAWSSTSDRALQVYGSNTAYIKLSDIFDDNKKGTLLGTLTYNSDKELAITGNYAYIGIKPDSNKGGASQLSSITIDWEISGITYSGYCTTVVAAAVAKPVITLAENPFLFSTTATITCATEGASIKYSFDGENWIDYSEVLTITSTTAIYAKATKDEDESAVASVTATKNLAEPTVTIDATGITNTNVFYGKNAGSLSATVTYNNVAIDGATVTWSGDNNDVATIDPSTGAVTLVAAGTVTFTATYAENSDYSEKAATYQMTVIDSDPNAPGTENNPYTVAQAIEATPTSGTSANVYIKGIVSKFYNNSIVGDGSNYRYYISDDGTTTNQLLVYKGKGLNNVAFSNADDLQIGDEVVILGSLTMYNKAPEVAQGNYIVSLTQIPSSAVAFADETPSINFPAITTYQQEATAAEGYTGTITYEITENTAGATIEGSTVTVTKEGSVTVKAVAPAVLGAFKKSEATYTLTVTDTRAENGLAFANAEQEVIVGETLNAPTLNNPNNLTVTYSSEDVTIATVDESGNVTGVAVGTTTITATFDGNDGFKPGNVSYTLTVKKAPFAITDGFFDFGAGEDYGSKVTASDVKVQTSTWTAINVTMYMEGRNCWFGGNEIRLYRALNNDAGSITLSVPTGYVITNIAFTGASLNKMSAAVGTYSTTSDNKSATWTGNANSVKFTASDRTDIYTIKVTYSEIPATLTKTVTAAGWATYAPTFPVSFNSGEAYIVSSVEDGEKTMLNEVASVPAGTPVLLKGIEDEETKITMIVVESSDTDVTGNCLKVSNGTAISTNDKPIYVLANREKGVGFYKWTGSALSAGKIYLEFSESTSRSFFALPGSDLTGIDDVTVAEGVAENVFDLQGRRVAKATKGLYIVNGKKTVIK